MFGRKKEVAKPSQAPVDPAAAQRALLKQRVDTLVARQEAERREVNQQRLRSIALKCASVRQLSPAATLEAAEKYLSWLQGLTAKEATEKLDV